MYSEARVYTDTKGTCQSVRIIRVPVLSGLLEKTKADILRQKSVD